MDARLGFTRKKRRAPAYTCMSKLNDVVGIVAAAVVGGGRGGGGRGYSVVGGCSRWSQFIP